MIDWFYLEKDLQTCSIPTHEMNTIVDRLLFLDKQDDEFSHYEIEMLMERIRHNQLDPIIYGFNYGSKDIINHLKKLN